MATVRPDGSVPSGRYVATAVTGHPLAAGTRPTFTFRDGRVTAWAGCNTLSGTVTVRGGRLTVGPLSMTEIGCPSALAAQDQWLSGFLQAGPAFELAGRVLTVRSGGVTIGLTQPANTPLLGTRWILDGLITGDAVSSLPPGISSSIQITGQQLLLTGGCNGGSVEVTTTDTEITVGPMQITNRACQGARIEVEAAILRVLRGKVRYALDGDTLTLTGAAGHGLHFTGQTQEPSGPTLPENPGPSVHVEPPPTVGTARPPKPSGPEASIPEGPGMRK